MHKDVTVIIVIASHQVSCTGVEDDKAAITANAWVKTVAISLSTSGVHTNPCGGVSLSVMHKDVTTVVVSIWCIVVIASHQVRCSGDEGDKTAITADAWLITVGATRAISDPM